MIPVAAGSSAREGHTQLSKHYHSELKAIWSTSAGYYSYRYCPGGPAYGGAAGLVQEAEPRAS